MTTPVWPTTLSTVSMGSYGFKPGKNTVRTDMESGLARVRRRFLSAPSEMTCVWQFNRTQLGIFEKFYDNDLESGAAWFYVKLVNGVGETTYLARFKDMFEAKTSVREFHWEVSGVLEVLERPLPA